jgi:hypothetical protein
VARAWRTGCGDWGTGVLSSPPIFDPRVWVDAFNAIPDGYKWGVLVAIVIVFSIRYWRKNGGSK